MENRPWCWPLQLKKLIELFSKQSRRSKKNSLHNMLSGNWEWKWMWKIVHERNIEKICERKIDNLIIRWWFDFTVTTWLWNYLVVDGTSELVITERLQRAKYIHLSLCLPFISFQVVNFHNHKSWSMSYLLAINKYDVRSILVLL